MDAAYAWKRRACVWLAPKPCLLGPLSGAPIVGRLLTGCDHVAVGSGHSKRIELPAEGGGHGFIQQCHSLRKLTLGNQNSALVLNAQGQQVFVLGSFGYVEALFRQPQCTRRVCVYLKG